MINVKICGITNIEDAEVAINFGADALGFNFVPGTPRFLEDQYAKEMIPSLSYFDEKIGVFADEKLNRVEKLSSELELKTIQFHGNETPQDCDYFLKKGFRIIRALRVKDSSTINVVSEYENCTILLDSFVRGRLGGTGKKFNWSLAKDLAPDVRVNAIAPGAILWPDDKDLSDSEKESILKKVAMERIGKPEDIASTIFFLTESKYITGQIINVDGGRFSF